MQETKEFTFEPKIAYFSMEIGLLNDIPTYSGGLGVLAGDTIKSGADLKIPMVAVTLFCKYGYFLQEIDAAGQQTEKKVIWKPEEFMTRLPKKVSVTIEGREVVVGGWQYIVKSQTGGRIPVFFLDTDFEENSPDDRDITSYLYGGDKRFRLKQEIVLGIGGVRMLNTLGIIIKKYHMNEGHASLLTLELLQNTKKDIEGIWTEQQIWDFPRVKDLCVFTTHTPVEAGHDKFPYNLVSEVLGEFIPLNILKDIGGHDSLNMTLLALNLSKYINGVAKKHGEVSKNLFPGYAIHSITNGIHPFTWTCKSMAQLFDKYIEGWANEPELFVRSFIIPNNEVWDAHLEAKRKLLTYIKKSSGVDMDKNYLTIGFARRATAYKRADLLLSDIERLIKIGKGKIQIVYAGKAHPQDMQGKEIIKKIISTSEKLKGNIKLVYLQNYNMEIALSLVSGVDIWMNTPLRPREASGTSGMKASINGVINFSVLDGWWIEGHIEGVTGWSIGPKPIETNLDQNSDAEDIQDMYKKLEKVIIPMYYNNQEEWIKIMKNTIGMNAYYFNTHRMMRRYVTEAYIR